MIPRAIVPELERAAQQMPVVTVTGPRQSGKTTLCRAAFPHLAYINLEPLDTRGLVREDPRGFLQEFAGGAVIDEVQNVPELLSYLQVSVDDDPTPGRYILTGSQQLAASEAVSQTLAGRTAILQLLPFSLGERRQSANWVDDLWTDIFRGSYPRIYDRDLDPERWYTDYITTYVERDVRQVREIGDLTAFRSFVSLAAGRTAQEVNLSSIGSDAGVTHPTARSWLSILEASFVTFTATAWHRNVRKQIVRAPKLHFVDTGVACSLLGIRNPDQLRTHPLRGALFESWVAAEMRKALLNRGRRANLMHYRESRGLEIDIVVESASGIHLIECKSGATIQPAFLSALSQARDEIETTASPQMCDTALVYGGAETHARRAVPIYAWRDIDRLGQKLTEK